MDGGAQRRMGTSSMGKEKRIKKPHVLVVYPGLIPSVEISVLIPLRYLEKRGKIEMHAGTVAEMEFMRELSWCDIVVFSRCCLVNELPVLCKVRQLHIPYIYDLDDNFFRLAADKEQTQLFLQWPGVMETLKAFASGACVVKTGSEQIRMDMQPYNTNVVIHPYVFDFTLVRKPMHKSKKETVIGYAGSLVHGQDLLMVCEALNRIAQEYPEVRFAFYGAKPQDETALSQQVMKRSEFIPFKRDYRAFIGDLSRRGWTIVLAPLKDSITNRSKTDNKYREYSACGMAGVYSKMPVYERRIQDGYNGMLADYDAQSWYEKIKYLLDRPGERETIARRAQNDVMKHNRIDVVAERWLNDLILPNMQQELLPPEERKRILKNIPDRIKIYRNALSVLPKRAQREFFIKWVGAFVKNALTGAL